MTNTSQNPERTNSRITYAATDEGIEKAKKALKIQGFRSKATFAELCGLSRTTITKFFGGKPIQQDCFKTIHKELELLGDWKEIANIENFDNNEKLESKINSGNQTIEKEKVNFAVTGSVDKENVPKLRSLLKLIQKLTKDDSIDIIDIEEASIKLTLNGSSAGLNRLEKLFQSGKLNQIFERELNIIVENVAFVNIQNLDGNIENQTTTKGKRQLALTIAGNVDQADIDILKAALIDTSDDKETENTEKARLAEEIRTQGAIYRDLRNSYLNDETRLDEKWRQVREIVNLSKANRNLRDADLRDADLRNADLRDADLRNADLCGTELRGVDLSDAELRGANLRRANLRGTELRGADLRDVDLNDVKLSDKTRLDEKWRLVWEIVNLSKANRNLRDADLNYADLRDANLRGADLRDANLRGANLRRANLRSANLCGTELSDTDLRGVKLSDETRLDEKWRLVWEIVNLSKANRNLRDANLGGANLRGANLNHADLRDTNLRDANLNHADLRDADLNHADLRDADLRDAFLNDADLRDVFLSGADLRDANLNGADLRDANLNGADLNRVNLRYANLRGADLNHADLNGADLRYADLNRVSLRGVELNDETRLDEKWRLVWEIVNLSKANRSLSGADLSGADLNGADLSGADLNHANLSGANLNDKTRLDEKWRQVWEIVNLSKANLSLRDTDLSGADLSLANLRGAHVKNTYFSDRSLGISGSLKHDLIARGAIFDDSPGDRSKILTPVNY